MRRLFLPVIIFGLVMGMVPAIAQRHIADQRELNLFRQVSTEPDALKRLVTLQEWEVLYPNSDFRRERMLYFSAAYKESGQVANALQIATQMLNLDPRDIKALMMIVKIGPTLEAPSLDQVKAVEDAALNILYLAPELAQAATAPRIPKQGVADATAIQANDPEMERTIQMIREWRRNWPIKTAADVESEFRAIAETALAWARKPR